MMDKSVMESSKSGKTFKQHLIEDLHCSFCLQLLEEPMMTVCDHLFCKKCLANSMKKKSKQCPVCKGNISKATTRSVPNIVNNILNKLKEMQDDRFPYNQTLQLTCPVERIVLDDEIRENQNPANQNLTNLQTTGLPSVTRRASAARTNRELRSHLQSIVVQLNRLNNQITVSDAIPTNELIRRYDGLGSNVGVANLVRVFDSASYLSNFPRNQTNPRSPNPAQHHTTNDPTNDPTNDASHETNEIKKSLKKEFLDEVTCAISNRPPSCRPPGLSTMNDPQLLMCNHIYCKICILTWLETDDKTCPICKKTVLISSLKSGPRVLRKLILKLNALPDIDLEAIPVSRKRKIIDVICLDETVWRPIPAPKKSAGKIPVVVLD